MHLPTNIRSVSEIVANNRIALPEQTGVYAFWWIGDRASLLNGNRKLVLNGPSEQLIEVEY